MARAWLTDRSVLSVTGQDRVGFLQGLVSNDVTAANAQTLVWSGFLTPQGRYLADFFIWHTPQALLLDVPADQASFLCTRLSRFRLRADVQIEETSLAVEALWAEDTAHDSRPDPRLEGAGSRRIIQAPQKDDSTSLEHYHQHRLLLGLPDARDCEYEKTLLIEANFDWLNGISFQKGCYMGQELTARTHYRGLVKKRLVPVRSDHGLPPSGTILFEGEREIGQMRSSIGMNGLAFLRREVWMKDIHHEGLTLTPCLPAWFREELS
ncbi:CAF17-like 4Fe-4S cluster assembly/insertion protein YgfZ [Asaia prunellae]|uniref:CAF17-like 4Fe-4S cluster assembly/insertion protein YgfZ n=1 Tax=Asaia prunellae TaxID=610245 RepID=UPI0004712A77|nr:folate-binding protein YgfZ [Asaia prunellae]